MVKLVTTNLKKMVAKDFRGGVIIIDIYQHTSSQWCCSNPKENCIGTPNIIHSAPQFVYRGDLLSSPTAPPGGAADPSAPGNDAAETTQNPENEGQRKPVYHNEVGEVSKMLGKFLRTLLGGWATRTCKCLKDHPYLKAIRRPLITMVFKHLLSGMILHVVPRII